jgi:hypothetical protein
MEPTLQRKSRRQNDCCPCRSCAWEGLHAESCSVHEPGAEEAAYLDGALPACDCGQRKIRRAPPAASRTRA